MLLREDLCRPQKLSALVLGAKELPELRIFFLFYHWVQGQSLEKIPASPNMSLTFGDGSGERLKSLGLHSFKKLHVLHPAKRMENKVVLIIWQYKQMYINKCTNTSKC